jgi:hypothetical protein
MGTEISREARKEVLESLRSRYGEASRAEKSKILDEFVALAGCHRKHAIRLLTATDGAPADAPRIARRIYTEAVREALVVLWEAADRICGKRLKAILPDLVAAMERHGHLSLDPTVRELILGASAATIDRLLAPIRRTAGRRRKRKVVSKVSRSIPVRTFADWKEPGPGFLEVDFVAHCGESMEGTFLWSLVATDVCSGWIEVVPLLAREQSLVAEALDVIRQRLPVAVCGLDTDNDSAFINETLRDYCERHRIEFTRSRPYHKNDQAWIEQKNGAVVRRFAGYGRLSGLIAGQCLGRLYGLVRLYVNYFQPSFKLLSKERDGAKLVRRHDKPTTPCDRLLKSASVSAAVKKALKATRAELDPLALLHEIREGQAALAALSSGDVSQVPGGEGLEEFLAKLPELRREGEVRPTHRNKPTSPRDWRTREDPFEEVWPEILLWLQEAPDSTAKSLMGRLHKSYPGRFDEGQLRTLQRRIRDWRRVMAKSIVYSTGDPKSVTGSTPNNPTNR